MQVINTYAPIFKNRDEIKEQVHNDINQLKGLQLLILRDFNAKVDKDRENWPSWCGKHKQQRPASVE